MPIPLEFQDKEENQEPSNFLISQLETVLEYGGEKNPRIDEKIRDVTLPEIDKYMEKIRIDQDLPFKLTNIWSKNIPNEETFNKVCQHCNISNIPFNSSNLQKIYFIQMASNAVVFIPIQTKKREITICIELLDKENTLKEIYDMFQKGPKLTMDEIERVKYNNYK